MTQVPTDMPAIEQPPVQVKADPGSRLEQLHESYAAARAELGAAEKKMKAITDALKLELTGSAPEGTERIELVGSQTSGAAPLQLSWVLTWRFDSKRFKTDDPVTYVRYAKQSGSWTLRPVKAGGDDS